MQAQVLEFHQKFGQPVGLTPEICRPELRARLILEEAFETVNALVGTARARDLLEELRSGIGEATPPDLVEAADGMCDTLYVVFGAAVEMGIDLQPLFDEVHRTNMAKEGGAMRSDGKILKPTGWVKPDLATLLDAQRSTSRG